ncbi:hypothetical protein D3C72_2128120 [compost metagenome]
MDFPFSLNDIAMRVLVEKNIPDVLVTLKVQAFSDDMHSVLQFEACYSGVI